MVRRAARRLQESGRRDSNPRPPAPKAGALPSCATPRVRRRLLTHRYTLGPVKAVVEPLEGNKVKLSVEVDESEFEKDIDAAFRRIAKEVRLPGFRPGKAPRRILEAKLGKDVGREEALREALPSYYIQAIKDHEVDVIAAPEIDITAGKDEGPIAFDAVVEVRPTITVGG